MKNCFSGWIEPLLDGRYDAPIINNTIFVKSIELPNSGAIIPTNATYLMDIRFVEKETDWLTYLQIYFGSWTYHVFNCTDKFHREKVLNVPPDWESGAMWKITLTPWYLSAICNSVQVVHLQYDTVNRTQFPYCVNETKAVSLNAVKFSDKDNATQAFMIGLLLTSRVS